MCMCFLFSGMKNEHFYLCKFGQFWPELFTHFLSFSSDSPIAGSHSDPLTALIVLKFCKPVWRTKQHLQIVAVQTQHYHGLSAYPHSFVVVQGQWRSRRLSYLTNTFPEQAPQQQTLGTIFTGEFDQ